MAATHIQSVKTYGSTDAGYNSVPVVDAGMSSDIFWIHHWWKELTTHHYHERMHVYQDSSRALWDRCEEICIAVMASGVIDPNVSPDVLRQLCRWITDIHMNLQEWAQQDIITALASSAVVNETIQQLYRSQPEAPTCINATPLATSIQEVLPCIERVLTTKDLRSRLENVEKDVASRLIDLFDEVIPYVDTQSRLRYRLFHALRRLCSEHLSLPRSYTLDGSIIKQDRLIGSGGFADVYYGEYRGQAVAIKAFRSGITLLEQTRKMFCREACTWRHLSHPNVLQFIGIDESQSMFCLVSRWMEGGHIISFLEKFPHEDRTKLVQGGLGLNPEPNRLQGA